VHDDEAVQIIDAMAPHQRRDGQARVVVEGLREGEGGPARSDADLAGQRALLAKPEATAVATGQQLDRLSTGVVTAARMLLAGISQTDDQQVRRCSPSIR